MSTPLDCWREVGKFKASVANVEQVVLFLSCSCNGADNSCTAIFQDATVMIYTAYNMDHELRQRRICSLGL